jgi:hypothetical protein
MLNKILSKIGIEKPKAYDCAYERDQAKRNKMKQSRK